MARRAAAEIAADSPSNLRRSFQWLFYFVTGLVLVVGLVWTYTSIEQFLVSDDRFSLPGPPDPGIASEHFTILNAVHASDQQITNVFSRDFGRSVYLCPIQERRRKLLAIDWIKDATVTRLWPNRIAVKVVERTPIAFVQTPAADGSTIFALIDGDGVLLDGGSQPRPSTALPVVVGISAKETETSRRERVKRFLRLESELGTYMSKVSEIDVSDADNLKVVVQFDRRAAILMLGNQKFKERFETFLNNMEEIRQRMPGATIFDVRLKSRITAMGGNTR